ncbi:potassium-transporting ATPase subunit KdpA [Listeria monocytogenes]|uniref:potassium-transporting ATPase subunit KdpA n=1 Tax=Listeria monocytogenes TaxID=1639 RepID=UPI000BE089E9|nr:potassium-transporting ATPase subunit KdpA [Listeria monocytogenes]EAG5900286.1 potassium-transporting ATPase subunit KdpA [Listeria monocytogenes]EAG5914637.1 potassium-transporting ATPase subunit KdpA [Listeria monocytogenes]EAG6135701.1 potassium-transporting ATPase subunit KdpA [Listeria monocytogenes]EAG6150773.1 potassium-transporting ATPase subunit KdpA [Listeria monocytogenes]EAG6162865.1 potassium-transporting ATPase subunit KdpA [Listeria monocytogenes]
MKYIVMQDAFFVVLLLVLAVPLGIYMYKVMIGEKVFLSRVLEPVERFGYRLMGVSEVGMSAKRYAVSVLAFSAVGFVFVMAVLMLQGFLPLNPEGMKGLSFSLAFNTAASFVSNTNWQAYSGEAALSYFSQSIGLTVQNFVSAATGIAVLFAVIRGFIWKKQKTIGNFWQDLFRVTLYILLPLSLILALLLVSQGVVQSFADYSVVETLENGAKQLIPLGPAASQIAIKQLGTNGGGFFGANSAFPFENPSSFTNLIEMLAILLIPVALVVMFGRAVKDSKQGRAIMTAMMIVFVIGVVAITISEQFAGPSYQGVATSGSMEGKEVRFGVGGSSLFAASTTAASNGAVNAMHDSLTPLGGLVPMFFMQLGEVIFGGVGSGLYGMIGFIILTVFIAGLLVGRTPEYLGKKIEPYDMKMVCLLILVPPLLTLFGTAVAVMIPSVQASVSVSGAHGFSEVLYAFTSMGNNNGSAFAGFAADTTFTNMVGAVMMLLARFIPLVAALYLAQNMAGKSSVAASSGTLSTKNGMFIGLLIGVVVLVGALSFLPALALGPIADFFTTFK